MKKLMILLLLTACAFALSETNPEFEQITGAHAQDKLVITWDGDTTRDVNTLEFEIPFSVKCDGLGNCGGRIDVTFGTQNNIAEIGDKLHRCNVNSNQRTCYVKGKFRLYRGIIGPKLPTIQMNAVADADVMYSTLTASADLISINPVIGTLEGKITAPSIVKKGESFEVIVNYKCVGGVCFDVKIAPNYNWALSGTDIHECENFDGTEPCESYFQVRADTAGVYFLKGYAQSYNPPHTKLATENEAKIEVLGEGQQQEFVTTAKNGKNIFQKIWEWILGLFEW